MKFLQLMLVQCDQNPLRKKTHQMCLHADERPGKNMPGEMLPPSLGEGLRRNRHHQHFNLDFLSPEHGEIRFFIA